MPDEDIDLRDDIHRGQRAEQLLRDPLFTDAVSSIEAEYMRRWRATLPTETEKREHFYLSLKVLGEVVSEITHHLNTGKLAAHQLEDRRRQAKPGTAKKRTTET